MPLAEERSLKRGARKHGFKVGSPRYRRYVYGTLAIQKKRRLAKRRRRIKR